MPEPSRKRFRNGLAKEGKLGPVARLLPTTAATTLRKGADPPLVLDGPFAETKEQLLGFYLVDADLDEALDIARDLGEANPGGAYEIRPLGRLYPAGQSLIVTETAWIDAALTSARPQAVGALLRYFRDLDIAEEAFRTPACAR
jgi:hypothetical protein